MFLIRLFKELEDFPSSLPDCLRPSSVGGRPIKKKKKIGRIHKTLQIYVLYTVQSFKKNIPVYLSAFD